MDQQPQGAGSGTQGHHQQVPQPEGHAHIQPPVHSLSFEIRVDADVLVPDMEVPVEYRQSRRQSRLHFSIQQPGIRRVRRRQQHMDLQGTDTHPAAHPPQSSPQNRRRLFQQVKDLLCRDRFPFLLRLFFRFFFLFFFSLRESFLRSFLLGRIYLDLCRADLEPDQEALFPDHSDQNGREQHKAQYQ